MCRRRGGGGRPADGGVPCPFCLSTASLWSVHYVFVHSAEWFKYGTRIQAIGIHQTKDKGDPLRGNLVAPLYCNADVPLHSAAGVSVLNCEEWPVRDLPMEDAPTTVANFSATRTASAASVEYQSLNPLAGQLLLTNEEYELLMAGLLYVVMYMENDNTGNGHIRGAIKVFFFNQHQNLFYPKSTSFYQNRTLFYQNQNHHVYQFFFYQTQIVYGERQHGQRPHPGGCEGADVLDSERPFVGQDDPFVFLSWIVVLAVGACPPNGVRWPPATGAGCPNDDDYPATAVRQYPKHPFTVSLWAVASPGSRADLRLRVLCVFPPRTNPPPPPPPPPTPSTGDPQRNPNFGVGCFELIINKKFATASKMGKNYFTFANCFCGTHFDVRHDAKINTFLRFFLRFGDWG